MTRNRKADLQRKLAMAPVATPPAGLADRIKNDIPAHLGFKPESERAQLRKAAMFNLRIAASIVLLVSSLYLVLHLLSRTESGQQPAALLSERASAPEPRPAVALPSTPPEPGSARPQLRADLPPMPRTPPPRSIAAVPAEQIAEAKHAESVGMATGSPAYADSLERDAPVAKSEPAIVANAASAPAPAAVAPPPSPALEQEAPAGAAGGRLGFAPERSLAKDATTRERKALPAEPPVRNFVAIQEAIAHGESPRAIDAAAIVQHFAAPERPPADLHVELEASAAPLDATKWLLRVSVDAPAQTGTAIDLTFGDAVAAHRALAGSPAPNETALYEIEFKPDATSDQTIATVRAGKAGAIVRIADLHKWNEASPRMKRASLAAAWARTLQSHTHPDAIVAKAREAHIDDLADLAERTERNQ
ncbi:MAG TPA: hypothetical protein VNN08_13895 [Thermoanaerobaculia bacterium]|nr:hypothetical protein [Thermoanaerobaculia bacterium]